MGIVYLVPPAADREVFSKVGERKVCEDWYSEDPRVILFLSPGALRWLHIRQSKQFWD